MRVKFGFSYLGLILLLLLIIPNLIWSKNKPKGYSQFVKNENKILLCLERIGETLVTGFSLMTQNTNQIEMSMWDFLLVIVLFLMLLYEIYWIRYFRSKRTKKDFYCSLLGIPVAGATLPVVAFFLFGIYQKNLFLILSTIILGIGHIGIHINHQKEQ